MRVLLALALVLLPFAGCLSDGGDGVVVTDPPCAFDGSGCLEAIPHVVVADIDTGINVYHDLFQLEGGIPEASLAAFVNAADGAVAERVKLTTQGSWEERYDADVDLWDSLERGRLYYFEGTRILGISFTNDQHAILDYPNGSHGTATAGSVVDANPDAIIVLVEGVGDSQAEAWVAAQPWIDLVTMSYGPLGSVPASGTAFGLETHIHTKAMWDAGKLPVGAADNSPSLAPNDETAGPPWVVGVAGDHEATRCRDHVSGTFPDFTANFTQILPTANSLDERRQTSGTSFATPTTAGTFSRVLFEVRTAWNHTGGIVDGALAVAPDGTRLTQTGLRDAVNRTAYYFEFTPCPLGSTQLPVNPAAPWFQMGWGHVGPEIVEASVAHILGTPAPEKPVGAVAFQEALYQYRTETWSQM